MASHVRAIREIIKRLEKQGFTVEMAKSGHYNVSVPAHWTVPQGQRRKIQIPATPSIERTVLNTITRLKKMGYKHE